MAPIFSKEAGPEWEYCARLGNKNHEKVEFDYLYINVRREGEEPTNIIDSLQVLSEEGKGPQSDRFDFSYRAFEDIEDDVAIPDSQSFRRLLVAIGHLGLPLPVGVDPGTNPPVLRFFAKPKEDEEAALITVDEPAPTPELPQPTRRRNKVQQPQDDPVTPATPPPVIPPPEIPPPVRRRNYLKNRRASRQGSPVPAEDPADTGAPPVVSPRKLDVPAEAGDHSFLAVPKEPEEDLTFEDRIEHDLDYGFGDQNGVHDEDVHNLYADIAGIDRDKRDPGNPLHEYKPPYSRISLPPHQSYPTGWLLRDSAKILHYLADKPGVGKTFAACEAMVRIMLILSNGIAIKNEREQLPELRRERPLHIHEEASASGWKNTTCRANTVSTLGFHCQCDPKSPLYRITQEADFSEGFMLVLVPLELTDQWFSEITRFIRSNTRLPHNQETIKVVDIHATKGSTGEALKEFIYARREHHGLGYIAVVPQTTTVSKTLKELMKESHNLVTQASLICIDEIHGIRSVDHESVSLVKQLIRLAFNPVHVLCLSGSCMTTGPSDFKVVESIALNEKSFGAWHGEAVYDKYKNRLLTARATLDEHAKQIKDAGIVGRGRKHQIPEEEKAAAHDLMKAYDRRCREYAVVVPLLQRMELDDYLGYRIPKSQPNAKPTEIIRCDSNMNELQKRVANEYKQYLRLRYHHRVRVYSRKPVATRGPKPKMREVLFELDARQAPLKNSTVSRTSILEASLIAFAPGLAESVLKRSAKSEEFRSAEVNKIFKGTTTASQRNAVKASRFWPQAMSAFEKLDEETGQVALHPKIEAICGIIDKMLADREPHGDAQKKFGVFPKKAIITVPHPWQGYILIAHLFWRYPNRNFTFVGSGSSPTERHTLFAPFRRTTEVRDPADGRSDDPIALISTYDLIGIGLNLTRCNYAILTSPLSSMADQTQMFSRINRKGQHCTTHTYVLVDNGNPVDVTTFHRMQQRTALTVPDDERGPGLEFLLERIDEIDNEEVDTAVESGNENSEPE